MCHRNESLVKVKIENVSLETVIETFIIIVAYHDYYGHELCERSFFKVAVLIMAVKLEKLR